jgi:hypothetical protein
MVAPGRYPGRIDHYSLLRTIEDMYGLTPIGKSADATPITGIWRTGETEGGTAVGGTLIQTGAATRAQSGG